MILIQKGGHGVCLRISCYEATPVQTIRDSPHYAPLALARHLRLILTRLIYVLYTLAEIDMDVG